MASAMRKMAVYLGLVEDDHRYQDKYDSYGEYEEYEEPDLPEAQDAPDRAAGERREASTGSYQPDWRAEHVSSDDRSRADYDTPSSYLQ